MNLAHIHVVLNHVPSLGCLAALLMLAASIYKQNDGLKRSSFALLVLVSMATLPTYLTGNGARRLIADRPDAALGLVEVHQNAAMLTLLMMTIAGSLAWFGLWEFRRFSRAGTITSLGALLFTALTSAFLLYTALLGGRINHLEIREAGDTAIAQEVGWRAKVEEFMGISWAWPAAETLHFIGMVLLFGVFLLLLMRMLGAVQSIPFAGIHRLLPLGILGFVINVITGMLFYIAGPGGYIGKKGFILKIACVLLAAVPVFYFTVAEAPWRTEQGATPSATSKIAAVCGFTFLLGVIVFGRLLPFFN